VELPYNRFYRMAERRLAALRGAGRIKQMNTGAEETLDTEKNKESGKESQPVLESATANIALHISNLEALFRDRIAYDQAKETAFDVLYQKLEESRRDHEYDLKSNLLQGIVMLYDRISDKASACEEGSKERRDIQDLRQEDLDLLSLDDVVVMPKVEKFDMKCQKAIEVIPTTDSSEDGSVAKVHRDGFLRGERIVRYQLVSISRVTAMSSGI